MNEKLDLLILAAGKGERMGTELPKQFLNLCGKPVIIHTIEAFYKLPYIGDIYITMPADYMKYAKNLLTGYGCDKCRLIAGGKTRQESVLNGLDHIQTHRMLTHNAVLPLVTKQLIDNVVNEYYDCVTTVTDLEYNLCKGDHFAEQIVSRKGLKLINSPQSFITDKFRNNHYKAIRENISVNSDCELMMHYNDTVRFVPGDITNFKITTPMDFAMAEYIMRKRQEDKAGKNKVRKTAIRVESYES